VKVLLRSTNLHLRVQGKTIQNGVAPPGTFHITEPSAQATALFRGPYDALHIYIPDRLMSECAAGLTDKAGLPGPMSALVKDAVVESLARALLDADGPRGEFNGLYLDSIGVALVARLLHATSRSDKGDRPKIAELSRWRLKRAIDFIEAELDRSLTLAEIAAASGLSRMHFAAQFRAATGLRPHEFLLRRRVERAQELLAGSDKPIVDIALSVGFQTQSHFTTLFKRFVGHTPQAWRRGHATR
jgi:AraC-like DNA-binding protein